MMLSNPSVFNVVQILRNAKQIPEWDSLQKTQRY